MNLSVSGLLCGSAVCGIFGVEKRPFIIKRSVRLMQGCFRWTHALLKPFRVAMCAVRIPACLRIRYCAAMGVGV